MSEGGFFQFGRTGATFNQGIAGPEPNDNGTLRRPAEFGNWAHPTDLNPEYDAASANVVLITFGANVVDFVSILKAYLDSTRLPLECTARNPGPTVKLDFFYELPLITEHIHWLAAWIRERGGNSAPAAVFTDYYDPFPATKGCFGNTLWLSPDQIAYLSSLIGKLDETIEAAVESSGSSRYVSSISSRHSRHTAGVPRTLGLMGC